MLLGNPAHLRRAHCEAAKGYAPAELCETVVRCLELVAQAAAVGLDFRFKGGNSLLLVLPAPERLSIDVDVDARETKERMVEGMEEVVRRCDAFTRLEVRPHKTKPWLPMISFNVYFESAFPRDEPAFVMFDAVLKEPPGPGRRVPVRVPGIYEAAQEVEVMTPAGLMGDKLLTIGPSTVGIPLGKKKDAQRLKHVFDVARLASLRPDRSDVRRSLEACLAQENEIQRKSWSWPAVAEDTVRFCEAGLAFASPPDPAAIPPTEYAHEIATGFAGFRGHVFRRLYGWDDLRADLAAVRDVVRSLV